MNDTSGETPTPEVRSNRRRWARPLGLVATGAVAGVVLAATFSAGAQTATPSPSAASADKAGRSRGSESALSGTDADKAKAAALGGVPGATINRLETDADGAAFEAHMTKADGTRVTVKMDKDFKVTATETGGPGLRGHRGGPGGRPGVGETALTGDTAEKVKAAALEAVAGGTIIRVETDSDGSPYEAHVAKSDGTEVVVKVDKDFKVTATEDHKGPGRDAQNG